MNRVLDWLVNENDSFLDGVNANNQSPNLV